MISGSSVGNRDIELIRVVAHGPYLNVIIYDAYVKRQLRIKKPPES